MLIASNNLEKLNHIKQMLKLEFEMTDLGKPELYLGFEITRDRNNQTLKINQRQFMQKILQKFNMQDSRQHSTPMVTKGNSTKQSQETGITSQAPYREAIGSLLYLSGGSRPDLSYSVNFLSRKQCDPHEEDWQAVKRVFRYIRGTLELGLIYKGETDFLELYTDSSFADCDDSHSTSGYIIKLFGDTIAWKSHKQSIISMSTCEAEYISLSEGCMELIALHKIIGYILETDFTPINVFCDNKAAVDCVSLSFPLKLRHSLQKNLHYVKEAERANLVKVLWISSEEQLADILTKPLPIKPHVTLRDKLLNTV